MRHDMSKQMQRRAISLKRLILVALSVQNKTYVRNLLIYLT